MGTFHQVNKFIPFLSGPDPDPIHIFLIHSLRLLIRLLCTWFWEHFSNYTVETLLHNIIILANYISKSNFVSKNSLSPLLGPMVLNRPPPLMVLGRRTLPRHLMRSAPLCLTPWSSWSSYPNIQQQGPPRCILQGWDYILQPTFCCLHRAGVPHLLDFHIGLSDSDNGTEIQILLEKQKLCVCVLLGLDLLKVIRNECDKSELIPPNN